jgi:NADH-quinone oxidoreductase subunit C
MGNNLYQISEERKQSVIGKIAGKFPEQAILYENLADMLCFTVDKQIVYDLLMFLKDDGELQFNFLTTLCGMHYPERQELGVVYHLHSFAYNHRIRIKTTTPVAKPVIPSVTGIWPAANWMERETYDFFGIEFTGHPNLKRILNVDEMIDFPMRKEFPLEDQTRKDKDDSMFGR